MIRWQLREEEGRIWLSTPYNPKFVAMLKAEIPVQDREWDSARRIWKIDATYKEWIRVAVHACFGQSLPEEPERPPSGYSTPGPGTGAPRWQRQSSGRDGLEVLRLRTEVQHLNQVIRSLNIDLERARRDSRQSASPDSLLSRILQSEHGKRAWRRLAQVLHPDAGGNEQLFKELEALWNVAESDGDH